MFFCIGLNPKSHKLVFNVFYVFNICFLFCFNFKFKFVYLLSIINYCFCSSFCKIIVWNVMLLFVAGYGSSIIVFFIFLSNFLFFFQKVITIFKRCIMENKGKFVHCGKVLTTKKELRNFVREE